MLVRFDFFADLNYIQRTYKNRFINCDQDIIFSLNSSTLVIYKAMPKSKIEKYKDFAAFSKSTISANILNTLFHEQESKKNFDSMYHYQRIHFVIMQ